MDAMFWVNLLMRWLHVASAVVGIGATVMMRFVVMPNAAELAARIQPAYKRLIHSSLGLVLLTGFYNYLVVSIPAVRAAREQQLPGFEMYHAVMGVKMLLSLVLFGIAIFALQPREGAAENRKSLLSVNVVLGFLILLVAAYLRRLWVIPTP
ncbi:MAG: hypothetical protein ACK47B_26320 [Armatimonadota bacterium]